MSATEMTIQIRHSNAIQPDLRPSLSPIAPGQRVRILSGPWRRRIGTIAAIGQAGITVTLYGACRSSRNFRAEDLRLLKDNL